MEKKNNALVSKIKRLIVAMYLMFVSSARRVRDVYLAIIHSPMATCRRGMWTGVWLFVGGVGVIVVASFFVFLIAGYFGVVDSDKFSLTGDTTNLEDLGPLSLALCPDDGTTTLTLNVKNTLNTSGSETYDMAYRFTDEQGDEVISGSDSTDGSVTLICGTRYIVEGISESGADGDSAEFLSVVSGSGTAMIEEGTGNVILEATKATHAVTLGSAQHGVLEFRAKDIVNDGFMYDDQDSDPNDYETDGVTFNSTVQATQSLAVGSGGEVHLQLSYRPTIEDNIYGDICGYYILVDSATNVWEEPSVEVENVEYTNVKEDLNPDEKKAYTGYEYVYRVDKSVTRNKEHDLDFQQFAIANVNPGASDDIQIDFASCGGYASISNADDVKTGAVKDDTSQTQIHNLEDVTIDIS